MPTASITAGCRRSGFGQTLGAATPSSESCPQPRESVPASGHLGNAWGHFWLSQLGDSARGQWVEPREAAKHLTMPRMAHGKEWSSLNVNSAAGARSEPSLCPSVLLGRAQMAALEADHITLDKKETSISFRRHLISYWVTRWKQMGSRVKALTKKRESLPAL